MKEKLRRIRIQVINGVYLLMNFLPYILAYIYEKEPIFDTETTKTICFLMILTGISMNACTIYLIWKKSKRN